VGATIIAAVRWFDCGTLNAHVRDAAAAVRDGRGAQLLHVLRGAPRFGTPVARFCSLRP
jgi:hypothetical protein